jgi:hypothetical protein
MGCMNQFSSDWAARKHNHDMDRLQGSTAADKILDAIADGGNAVAAIGAAVAPPTAPVLGIARATFTCLGLFRKAWKFGKPSIDQMIEDIETGADAKFKEIDARLDGDDSAKKQFEERLQSQEAETARLSALFHGLRSSDPEKHKRLGSITISCIFADDLKPENLDSKMRAAVELTEGDISLLARIYKSQKLILENRESRPFSHQWNEQVCAYWEQEFSREDRGHLNMRGSLMRLQSLGFIASAETMTRDGSVAHYPFGLLMEGKLFYERLQEIGTVK